MGLEWALAAALAFTALSCAGAQNRGPVLSKQETAILQQIKGLRSLPDDVRAQTTKSLALQIRQLRDSANTLALANSLAELSTEGDFGHDTLQEVATTLADALQKHPVPAAKDGRPQEPYIELAHLVRYEHVSVALDDPQFSAAMSVLKDADARRQNADFALKDLNGKTWSLQQLRGKVVLVNFWATWCPPCRKEIPTLNGLYKRFEDQGFVVLGISDESAGKVKPFAAQEKISYPVLLDPGRKVNAMFDVDGIPKTFVYDRSGKLITESIDMRTEKQFLAMLAQAGLQ